MDQAGIANAGFSSNFTTIEEGRKNNISTLFAVPTTTTTTTTTTTVAAAVVVASGEVSESAQLGLELLQLLPLVARDLPLLVGEVLQAHVLTRRWKGGRTVRTRKRKKQGEQGSERKGDNESEDEEGEEWWVADDESVVLRLCAKERSPPALSARAEAVPSLPIRSSVSDGQWFAALLSFTASSQAIRPTQTRQSE